MDIRGPARETHGWNTRIRPVHQVSGGASARPVENLSGIDLSTPELVELLIVAAADVFSTVLTQFDSYIN